MSANLNEILVENKTFLSILEKVSKMIEITGASHIPPTNLHQLEWSLSHIFDSLESNTRWHKAKRDFLGSSIIDMDAEETYKAVKIAQDLAIRYEPDGLQEHNYLLEDLRTYFFSRHIKEVKGSRLK